jgi:hypothetical protein
MRTAALLAAFLGWGIGGFAASAASPGFGFLVGLGVGAGLMLIERSKHE